MFTWRRGKYAEELGNDEHGHLEACVLPDGEVVAIRNSRFFAERGVTIPRWRWNQFIQAVKDGEFDELPQRPRRKR